MAIEGLEIAPGGIGSGEAQIFKTPFTERAFMMKNEQERVRKAQEEEQFAQELSKIDVNGVHIPDAEDINKQYQELIDSYANVRNAKGRNERLKNKVIYEQKKKDLLMNIGSSKAYSKNLLDVGEKMLGSPEEWEDNARERYRQLKEGKSFGRTIDETQFRKKAKPADVIKIKDDIIEYSLIETQAPKAGKLDGKAGVFSNTTRTLDPNKYTDGFVMKLKQEPGFYTDIIQRYRSNYEKDNPNFAKLGEAAFLQYAIDQEYAKDLQQLQKSSKSTFNPDYVPNNNSFTFGGNIPVQTPTWNDPIVGTTALVENKTIGKNEFTIEKSIPLVFSEPAVISFKYNPSEGYFRKDGTFVKGGDAFDVKTTRVVVMPIAKSAQGYSLVSNETVTTNKRNPNNKIKKSAEATKNYDYITLVEAVDPYGETIYTSLESVPQGEINRADQPAFRNALQRNSKISFKQIGGVSTPAKSNNTSTPQGRVR